MVKVILISQATFSPSFGLNKYLCDTAQICTPVFKSFLFTV